MAGLGSAIHAAFLCGTHTRGWPAAPQPCRYARGLTGVLADALNAAAEPVILARDALERGRQALAAR